MAGWLCFGSAEHTRGVNVGNSAERGRWNPFLCGTDMERANEIHQWDRLILSQSTNQPFGFRHGLQPGTEQIAKQRHLMQQSREGLCCP